MTSCVASAATGAAPIELLPFDLEAGLAVGPVDRN